MRVGRYKKPRAMVAVGIATAFMATPAIAAVEFVCHPDPPGTHAISVVGRVEGFELRDGTAIIALRAKQGRCARLLRWRAHQGAAEVERLASCASRPVVAVPGVGRSADAGRVATVGVTGKITIRRRDKTVATLSPSPASPNELIALRGDRLTVITPSVSDDSPATLTLYSIHTMQTVLQWPVPYQPATLDVYRGTAVFSDARQGGVYALRLRDGRIGFVGANRRLDKPQIDQHGVAYEDGLYRRNSSNGRVLFKYVPSFAVSNEIRTAGHPVSLAGPMKTFAMDGHRVAAAYRDQQHRCDRIAFWNVPWNYLAPVSRAPRGDDSKATEAKEYPTCAGAGNPHVAALAIGGIRASWILAAKSRRLVTSTSAACVERVVPAGGEVGAVAADGAVLAYGTKDGRVRVIVGSPVPRHERLIASAGGILSITVDQGRIATLRQDGDIEVRAATGELLSALHVVGARAIALRADLLFALNADDTLEVIDTETGTVRWTWPVPQGVRREIDVHYGVAVLTRGRQIFAMNTATGKTILLATAPRPAHAQIEAPGIAYGYTLNGHGVLRFISLAAIQHRTS
jgi:outer membrane protein assembly factor BamB